MKKLAQKIEAIKNKSAYVSKCDGGYFFYVGKSIMRIKKSTFDKLNYEQGMIENGGK